MDISKIIATATAEETDHSGTHTTVYHFYADGTIRSRMLEIEKEFARYMGNPIPLDFLHIIDDELFHVLFNEWDD